MTSPRHWRLDCDANDIGWLCFDRQDASVNTLSTETMAELQAVLEGLSRQRLRGLVIHSGKQSGFIAGADINEFPTLDSVERAFALTRQGQMILDRLQRLPYPTVAVLNGFALGGGLELALACTRRIATEGDDPGFGLPEVQLGLHPGFGGTVRLPQLVGVRRAMDMILTGRSLRPPEALRAGLVDALIPDGDWRSAAVRQLERPGTRASVPLPDRLLAPAGENPAPVIGGNA